MGDGNSGGDSALLLLLLVLLLVFVGLPLLLLAGFVFVMVLVILVPMIFGFVLFVINFFVILLAGGGAETADAPQASFEFQYDDGSLAVTHAGGDGFDASSLVVRVNGEREGTWADYGGPGEVRAGDRALIPGVGSGDEVRLVWKSNDGTETRVLAEFQVPR